MKTPHYIAYHPFLNFFPTPSLSALFVALFLLLNLSSCHTFLCVVLLNDIMDLNLTCLGSLVPATPCVFCNNASNILNVWHGLHCFCWCSDLILHTQTNTPRTHGANRLTNIKVYTNTICAHNNYPELRWLNNLVKQKFTLQNSTMYFLFKNYSLVEIRCLLIRSSKANSLLWSQRVTIKME